MYILPCPPHVSAVFPRQPSSHPAASQDPPCCVLEHRGPVGRGRLVGEGDYWVAIKLLRTYNIFSNGTCIIKVY